MIVHSDWGGSDNFEAGSSAASSLVTTSSGSMGRVASCGGQPVMELFSPAVG